MYEIMKSAIVAGGYKLAQIQCKIKKLYILGDLTEEQTDELLALAAQGISADAERPETLALIQSLAARVEALEKKWESEEDDTEGETEAYEAWAAWDGISNKYQYGAVVSHKDKLWQSVFEGQNVWEPGTSGTESLWVEHNPETEA